MKGDRVVTKYLIRRILHGLVSIIAVVTLVMVLVYALGNRDLIFASDPLLSKQQNNTKITYKYKRWAEYGYLDYVSYSD